MREQLHNQRRHIEAAKQGIRTYLELNPDATTQELHAVFSHWNLPTKHFNDALSEVMSHPMWFDYENYTVHFLGQSCPLGETAMYRFLRLLSDAKGGWVEYEDICDICLDKDGSRVKNSTIRGLKRRVVEKLDGYGLAALADRIKPGKEKYRLDVS